MAENACVALKTVRAVARLYEEEGLDPALYEKQCPGREWVLNTRQKQRIVAMVCGPPPQCRARWSVRLIAEEAAKRKLGPPVSREIICILLENHDPKPWREKMWCIAELNPEFVARMEDVLALYEKPLAEKEPVVCMDEKPCGAACRCSPAAPHAAGYWGVSHPSHGTCLSPGKRGMRSPASWHFRIFSASSTESTLSVLKSITANYPETFR